MTATATKTPATPTTKAMRLAAAKVGSRARPAGGHLTRLALDTGAKVNLSNRPGFNTGCWRFEKGKHVIVLGDDFAQHLLPYGRTKRDKMATLFGEQILRHEAWHGRVSHRDLDQIAALCRTKVLPFTLVNLFEDARIEHLARQAEGDRFCWGKFHRMAVDVQCPLSSFMVAVHTEGTVIGWQAGPKWQELKAKVQEFYDRAIAAADTLAIVDLVQEWVEYWNANGYPQDKQRIDGTNVHANDTIGGASDGSLKQYSEQQNPRDRVYGGTHGRDTNEKAKAPTLVTWESFRDYTGNRPIDGKLADRIANRMREVIARSASPRSARVSTSASRLHIPGVAVGSEQSFRSYGKMGGKPTLVVVIDFSGSMSRDWEKHGRYFVAAVNRLVRSGMINATMYGTGGGKYAPLPATLTDMQVNQMGPYTRGENIRATLDAIASEMQAADAVIVYTDAKLVDGSVDAQAWRRRGVDLVGAVVISPLDGMADYMRSEMKRHFGSWVTAENGEALAGKLAQYLGQRFKV